MNFSIISGSKFLLVSLVLVCFSLFGVGVLCVSTTSAESDLMTAAGGLGSEQRLSTRL